MGSDDADDYHHHEMIGHVSHHHDEIIGHVSRGLEHMKCALGMTYHESTDSCDGTPRAMTFDDGKTACSDLGWRLPTVDEAQSLIRCKPVSKPYTRHEISSSAVMWEYHVGQVLDMTLEFHVQDDDAGATPGCNHDQPDCDATTCDLQIDNAAFPNAYPEHGYWSYWTSSPGEVTYNSRKAYSINYHTGGSTPSPTAQGYNVRCVRGHYTVPTMAPTAPSLAPTGMPTVAVDACASDPCKGMKVNCISTGSIRSVETCRTSGGFVGAGMGNVDCVGDYSCLCTLGGSPACIPPQ